VSLEIYRSNCNQELTVCNTNYLTFSWVDGDTADCCQVLTLAQAVIWLFMYNSVKDREAVCCMELYDAASSSSGDVSVAIFVQIEI
jgi:hypothetical protein